METNQWRSKKKIEFAAETLQNSDRRFKGQARMVSSGARKSLNEKLATVTINTHNKEPVNFNGVQDEIFLKNEELSQENGDFSPFRGVSNELLQRLELLGKDHQEEDGLRKIQSLLAENSQLKKSLMAKEGVLVSLKESKSKVESEFKVLMNRLDSTEKENTFLRYEYHVLEKEKREELEYTQRSMELTHKQQLRNVNKIVELEAECQRLRLLFRKKYPERSISTMLRNESERSKRSVNKNDLMMRDEVQDQKLKYDMLMEQIKNVREENKNLMDIILKKNIEIKDQKPVNASNFDMRSENVVSPSVSKEMSLFMDDFTEMEKFAIVTTEKDSKKDEKEGSFDWIQVVLSAISKEERISKRNVKELLQDIKIALGCIDENEVKMKKSEVDLSVPPLCITWSSSVESGSMTKDEIKRHLGIETPKMVAEKIECDEKQELRNKVEEFEEKIRRLEEELNGLKEVKEKLEMEIEAEKSANEELETKVKIGRCKLSETEKKLSSLEVELDYRKSCCEELEGTCLELQLQLESVETNPLMQSNRKTSQNGSACMKLSECQETIFNLRKQLRALSSKETSDTMKFLHKRSSLKDHIKDSSNKTDDAKGNNSNALIVYEPGVYSISEKNGKMEMIQRKKKGLGFLKKLLSRKRGVSNKKCLALTM